MQSKRTFWSQARLLRLSSALFVAWILAILLNLTLIPKENGLLSRGDFPAFYAAAVLVNQTNASEVLYDIEAQRRIENQFWPETMKWKCSPRGGKESFIVRNSCSCSERRKLRDVKDQISMRFALI